MATPHRGAGQPRDRGAGGDRSRRGALTRLGARGRLDDVVLLDAQGREALRLPRVTAALSVPALLALELRFEQLLVDGAQIEVRRDAQGRIRIAGLATGGAGDDGNTRAAADWFFRQHEFVIRGGSLLWIDEQRQSPQLALTDAVVVVRNGLLHHELRIDATPPAAWGGASRCAHGRSSR